MNESSERLSSADIADLHRPTPSEIFRGFLILGLTGFGGVLPLARHMLVVERRWLDDAEFADLLSLCQFLPGGNVINLSVAVGGKFHGARGAALAFFGLMAAPTVIIAGLGTLYGEFQDNPHVRNMFAGLAAAAAGLLIAMALRLLNPLRGKPLAIAVAALCFVIVAILRFPLLYTMLALAPLSIFVMWKFGR